MATYTGWKAALSAALGKVADTTAAHQITLTAPLVLTVPAGFPAGQVYRVTLTQDATGGHTVTYGGSPVTVDTTAGAQTLVDIWPNGEVAYPVTTPLSSTFAAAGISLPRALGGGADDTPAIQAALDAAAALMLSPRVTGLPGETYQTSGLVIHSGTTLDMTGCAIERMAGAGLILRNAAYGGIGQRDHDITVIGGEWRRMSSRSGAGTSAGSHTMVFHRVDGVRVRDARFVNDVPGGKYALFFCDVTDYAAEHLRFANLSSDAIHIAGPALRGHLSDVAGYSGDDFIGVTGRDYDSYQLTAGGGDVRALTISDVFLDGAASGILLLPGRSDAGVAHTISGVHISDVRGSTSGGHVMRFTDDGLFAGTTGGVWEDVVVEGVSVTTPGSGYGAPYLRTTPPGVAVGAVMRSITLRDITLRDATTQVVVNGAQIECLTVDQIRSTATAHAVGLIDVKAVSSIGTLTVRGLRAVIAGGYGVKQQGEIGTLVAEDWEIGSTGSGSAMLLAGATPRVLCTNLTLSRPVTVQGTDAPEISAANITMLNGVYFIYGLATAAPVLRGSNIIADRAIDRSGSPVLRATGIGVRADVAKITPVSHDTVYNYNVSAATCPYIGQVYYDGSAWRALRGFLKSGTVTLVGGTATVADIATTASTEVLLEIVTPGGAVGQPYVSARTAGTGFTITSTSPTDTSTVRWKSLRY